MGCHAEPVEAWWIGPLRATLRQAQGDRHLLYTILINRMKKDI